MRPNAAGGEGFARDPVARRSQYGSIGHRARILPRPAAGVIAAEDSRNANRGGIQVAVAAFR